MQEKVKVAAYSTKRWQIRPLLIATHTGLPFNTIASATKRPTDGVTDDAARELLAGIHERLSFSHLAVSFLRVHGKEKLKEILPKQEYLKVIITANDRLKKLSNLYRRRQAESLYLPSQGEGVRRLSLDAYLHLILQAGYYAATRRISKATNPDYAGTCVDNARRAGINKDDLLTLKTIGDYERTKNKAIEYYWKKRGVDRLDENLKKIYYGKEKKRKMRHLTEVIVSAKEIDACKAFEQFKTISKERTWEKISNRKCSESCKEIKNQIRKEKTKMETPKSFLDFCFACHKHGYAHTFSTLDKDKRNAYRRLLLAGDGAGFESLTEARAFFRSTEARYGSIACLRTEALLFRRVNLAKWPEPVKLRKEVK
jgi:hypothetical protein